MSEWLPTLVYAPLLAGSLCFADEVLRLCLAQELAASASFRGARAAAACVDVDGRFEADLDTRVRRAVAVALLPDARFGARPGRADADTARAVEALADGEGLELPPYTDLGEALTVEVRDGEGRRVRAGDRWAGGPLTVAVTWAHPLRTTPVAWALAEGAVADRRVSFVEASSSLWVDPPRGAR